MPKRMRPYQAFAAAAMLALAVSCGPRVVVARLATPTPQAAAPAAPAATPVPRPARPKAIPASATPAPRPPTPLPPTPTSAPPASPAAARQVPTAPPPTSPPTPTPTPTDTATPRPIPTRTPPPATFTPAPRPTTEAVSSTATATPRPRQTPTSSPRPAPILTPAAKPSSPVPTAAAIETAPSLPLRVTPPARSAAPLLPGEWDFRADAAKGIIAGILRFRSTSSGLAGVYVGLHGNVTELSNLRTAGASVSFDLVTPTAVWHLEGSVSADRIEGTFQTADHTIRWIAKRKASASVSPTP